MTLTIKQLKEILEEYPDDYRIHGLGVQITDRQYTSIRKLHELQIPCFDIDEVPPHYDAPGKVISGSSKKDHNWMYYENIS